MRMQVGVLVTAAVLSTSLARAGDPIQFSNDKAKSAPANTTPADSDIFKSWTKQKTPSASPLNSITPFITPGQRLDPKDERRLQNARDERKNWLLLEPGELQKRDEEEAAKPGGKAFSLSDADSENDYLVHGVAEQRSDRNKHPHRPAPAETEEQTKKDNRPSLSIFGPRDGEQQGAHTSRELNLKGLIDPSQVNAANMNKNEASLFQFLKDNSPQAVERNEQARRDSFRDFINGPQPEAAPPSGLSDPINFRPDLTQERMNPIMPNRPFDLPAPANVPEAFSVKPPLGFNPARPSAFSDMVTTGPRQPMTGPSLPSPFLTPNEGAKAARPSVMGNSPLFNRELPRRGGL